MLVRLNTNDDGNGIALRKSLERTRIEPARFIELACCVRRDASLLYFGCANKFAILENAFLYHIAIRKRVDTLTSKLPISKLPDIAVTIRTLEAAVPSKLIAYKFTFVLATIRKVVNASAVPTSLAKLPYITIASVDLGDDLLTIAVLFTIQEFAGIQNRVATCQCACAATPAG